MTKDEIKVEPVDVDSLFESEHSRTWRFNQQQHVFYSAFGFVCRLLQGRMQELFKGGMKF